MTQDDERSKADGPGEALVDEPTAEALETPEQSADKTEWEQAADPSASDSGNGSDPGSEGDGDGGDGDKADDDGGGEDGGDDDGGDGEDGDIPAPEEPPA